jgi:hypothetical protein
MPRFRRGQIVSMLGRFGAKVVDRLTHRVTSEVYEGLAPNQRPPVRASHGQGIVEAKPDVHASQPPSWNRDRLNPQG